MPQSATRSNRHSKQLQMIPVPENDNYDDCNETGHIFFWREWEEPHGFLCQFYRCSFTSQVGESPIPDQEDSAIEQHTFNCAEQYMMYHKALILATPDPAIRHTSSNKTTLSPPDSIPAGRKDLPGEVLSLTEPNDQKYLIRAFPFTVAQRKLYERTKFDIVVQGNYYKFAQNLDLKTKLLATGYRRLVEAAPNDRTWGIGFLARDARSHTHEGSWGANLLGEALMSVRERIRNEQEGDRQAASGEEHSEIAPVSDGTRTSD
ncbi:hypothetical protein DOTSEDRAFT_73602 [Dothistroma septosporum NZE10]|uniref:NADAR domain-containing protein n=1 Tax=Dothistroma septosporum (strain NZE10 / CBS 128990) TaxID=675120 RepID=N1PFW0_DOTSN|nr:hypothetical protein DOTSEDRAFT_73602 [Dothistroma septosporum NZE10]